MEPLTTCTVDKLLNYINNTVLSKDRSKWFVMVDEQDQTINLIDPKTMEMHGVEASKINYGK